MIRKLDRHGAGQATAAGRRRFPVGTSVAAGMLGLLALTAAGPATLAAATEAAPTAVVAAATAERPAGWVDVTDEQSGVTVALPGEAEPVAVPHGRAYAPEGAHVGLVVVDLPEGQEVDLTQVIDTVAPQSGVKVLESEPTTVDGHPALDAVIAQQGGGSGKALVRAISTEGHVIVLVTAAEDGDTDAVADTHRQLLAGVRLP